MLVRKNLSLTEVELKTEGDTGKFSGYASVFGGVDSYGDTILKGAFETTLKRDGKPKMFCQHNTWELPIGKWTVAKEDDHGLYVEGELTAGMSVAQDVYAALKHGTMDGLSIGGYLKAGDFDSLDDGRRIIKKWSRLVEISPVVFPADNSARVDMTSVKNIDFESALPECKTERDIEQLLRDAGLGKWEAMALVSRAKAILMGRDAQEEADAKAIASVVDRINRMAAMA